MNATVISSYIQIILYIVSVVCHVIYIQMGRRSQFDNHETAVIGGNVE